MAEITEKEINNIFGDAVIDINKQPTEQSQDNTQQPVEQPIDDQTINQLFGEQIQELPSEQPNEDQQQDNIQNIAEQTNRFSLVPDVIKDSLQGAGSALTKIGTGLPQLAARGVEMSVLAPFTGLDEAIKTTNKHFKIINDAITPKNEQEKEVEQEIFSALQQLNKIPAGWAGIAQLIASGSVNDAANTVKEVEEKGLPKFVGDLVFDSTKSPVLATIAESAPEIAGVFFGAKALRNRSAIRKAKNDLDLIEKITDDRFKLSPEQKIKNTEVAKFKLVNRDKWQQPTDAEIKALQEKFDIEPELAQVMVEKIPKLEILKTFKNVAKQEWDQGVLNFISTSSKEDLRSYKRQLKIYNDALKNPRLKSKERPIFEAGKPIADRVKLLLAEKSKSGKQVDIEAKKLKNTKPEFGSAVDSLVKKLQDEGVVFNDGVDITDLKQYNNIDFRRSLFDADENSQKLIADTIRKMTQKDFKINGFDLHILKKSLPTRISQAKDKGGINSRAEAILNDFRIDINNILRAESKGYADANDRFVSVIEPLNELNKNLPKKDRVDFEGLNPKNGGMAVRRIMSNINNASDIYDAIMAIEKKAKDLGFKGNTSAIDRAIFSINLDKRLGAFADASLQGVTEASQKNVIGSLPTSTGEAGLKAVRGLMRKVKKVDNEQAIKAMNDYLSELIGEK